MLNLLLNMEDKIPIDEILCKQHFLDPEANNNNRFEAFNSRK